MTDMQPYERLAELTAHFPLDDVGFDAYMWRNLYEFDEAHNAPEPETIVEVTHLWAISPEGYSDTNIALLARLTDGTWASCVAWSDTSGFGCQEDVTWLTGSRAQAISHGLDKEARSHLGLSPPGE